MNKIRFIKIASIILSVAGMVGSAWAGDKENKINLENLVNNRLTK